MSLLSVIIVTYNNEDTITPCLQSLFQHCSPHTLQVIVIDNNSQDGTRTCVRTMLEANREPHVVQFIENSANRLFAAAVNQGLELARGEHIALLNPDTHSQPHVWNTLIQFLENHPEAGVVGPRMLDSDGAVLPSCREFPGFATVWYEMCGLPLWKPGHPRWDHWRMGYFPHNVTRAVDQPMGACLVVRKTAVQRVGMLDPRFSMFFNDVDWCRRFRDAGLVNYFVAEAAMMHTGGHSVHQRRIAMILLSHVGFIRYLEKYTALGWFDPRVWCASLVLIAGAVGRICWHSIGNR